MDNTNDKSYESSDIQALSDLEAIRLRSGMYIGSTNDPRQLVIESCDNSKDEELAGYSDKLVIKYDTLSNTYMTRDYGRGIPIGTSQYVDSVSGETHDVETIQLLFTKTHSGGKFGQSSAYRYSSGLHGVGLCTIGALSSHVKSITYRDGKAVELIMSRGKVLELNRYDTDEPNGVYTEFVPDDQIFTTIKVPHNILNEICSIPVAFGLHYDLYIDDQLVPSKYNNMFELLPPESGDSNDLLSHSFEVNLPNSKIAHFKVAIKYTSDTNTVYRSYTNMLYNSSGGSHQRYFESIYQRAWEKYLTDEFKIQDVLVGLRAVIEVAIDNNTLAFSSQTKEKLTTSITEFYCFNDLMIAEIQKYFDEHEEERKGLIKRFIEYRQSKNKMLASKELTKLVYVNTNTTGTGIRRASVVPKLRECTSKDRKGTRLYIIEGSSAGGSFMECRDLKLHAILPLRGKLLNVAKQGLNLVNCMKNQEIQSIVNSAGTGIGEDCDASRSRYDMYCIGVDADEDGKNIACLVACVYVNFLPDLVKKGLVYVVQPPLYGWSDKTGKHYSNDIEEVTNFSTLHRYKGLGEMNADELYETCILNPTLVRLTYPEDLDKFNEVMTSPNAKFKLLDDRGKVLWT